MVNFTISNHDLRDHLAVERTILANKRTLLSYVRTAILLLGSGLTIIKLFGDQVIFLLFSGLIIVLGLGLLFIGTFEYIDVKNTLLEHRRSHP
jgi:putative membrane protein